MILNVSSILGFGSNVKNRRASLETDYAKQDLNFKGNTWATRWLLGVMPKGLYDPKKGDSESYDRLSQALADDMNQIISEGAMSLKNEKHWLVVLYVVGDWPFHQKTFHLGRTFGSVAKQPSSKTASKGICHNCLADQSGYPFEDFESPNPRWRSSVGKVSPFLRDPVFLQLPHDRASPTSMIGLDVFHGFHLGEGKVFCSSCLVLLSEIFPGTSVESRFESLHDAFFSWCARKKERPYIKKLSRETVKWIQSSDFPGGAWSKGSTTLCLLRFFIDICKEREQDIQGSLLNTCYLAALEVNQFFCKLYKEGVWIPGQKAREIAAHGFLFLKLNGRVAFQSYQEGRALFPFMPNLHRLHEVFFLMVDHVTLAGFCISPLVWSTQLFEDFIGKPSRISRRVSCRLAVKRTLQRSLEAAHSHFKEAGYIRWFLPILFNHSSLTWDPGGWIKKNWLPLVASMNHFGRRGAAGGHMNKKDHIGNHWRIWKTLLISIINTIQTSQISRSSKTWFFLEPVFLPSPGFFQVLVAEGIYIHRRIDTKMNAFIRAYAQKHWSTQVVTLADAVHEEERTDVNEI